MNYSQIKYYDIANGPGLRVSVWFCGCTLHCNGCFNSELWDFDGGSPFTHIEQNTIIEFLRKPQISGLSILGGEPLQQSSDLLEFLRNVHENILDKDIWMWTGLDIHSSHLSELQNNIIHECDYVVDGPYIESQNTGVHRFRGSLNQKIWYISKNTKDLFDVTSEIDNNNYLEILSKNGQGNI